MQHVCSYRVACRSGREAGIGEEVVGIMSNPNCEYEPNFIPLRTL